MGYEVGDEYRNGYSSHCCDWPISDPNDGWGRCKCCGEMAQAISEEDIEREEAEELAKRQEAK